ncbi:hypothetical protein B0H65DRAFT_478965 [Neurospora tetraspora]|uniref:Uncharacterized protein n=1 Tax=Neurospora tetraspora TaxID=94610 RepID=A0AAE0J8H4_9PEZI|nr:hypothetical protein B0H65DRAFT_478965 [Neurospora tetraspora]
MTDLYHFRYESIQTSIQRLDIDRSRLHPGEIKDLQDFVKLKKLYIHGDSYNFRWVFRKNPLPCGQKDIILHDTEDHITLNTFDWDEIWDDNLGYMAANGFDGDEMWDDNLGYMATMWGGDISVGVQDA